MKVFRELNGDELSYPYKSTDFVFETISNIITSHEFNPEEKLVDDLKRILEIDYKGFNIYISGVDRETEKNMIIQAVHDVASKKMFSKVIGYVYNFEKPEEPMLLELDMKVANEFQMDLEELRNFIALELQEILNNESIDRQKEIIKTKFEEYKLSRLLKLEKVSSDNNLKLELENDKIVFVPKNYMGEKIDIDEYESLTSEEKESIEINIDKMYEIAEEVINDINDYEKKSYALIEDICDEIVLKEIQRVINYLRQKYIDSKCILKYFESIGEELIDSLKILSVDLGIDPRYKSDTIQKITQKYYYNKLNNDPISNIPPVVIDENYMQASINGRMVINPESVATGTMFKQLKGGLLHYAWGGYLIIHMDQIINDIEMWKKLKGSIITKKIVIDNVDDISTLLGNHIRPQNCKLDTKVVLIGNEETYNALYEVDKDFSKLFKYHIHFEDNLNISQDVIENVAKKVGYECKRENLKPVKTRAFLKTIEIYQKELDLSKRIPRNIEFIMDILRLANTFAVDFITDKDIENAIEIKNNYNKYIANRIDESYIDGTYLVETKGSKVGQINGLAVYAIGGISLGRPTKITATTYKGTSGIIDIEKQSNLSGEIHTKGINILSGFLGKEFAQDNPLSITCNICFEQSYGIVEGDSASVAELYAILSSLSELPILQNIAVTGSMNQFGDIQPIGGVNHKIEGFFEICKKKNFDGVEGVIIPVQNVKDLILNSEVIEAVNHGKFHIYPIKNVWDGAEIVFNKEYSKIVSLVKEKLIKFG